jgi:catalase
VRAFRFELTRVQVTAIRERMVANLLNVDEGLAQAVAEGLGIEVLPKASPKALAHAVKPEVKVSPALSLFARPGDRSIRTRQVALLVADGVDGPQVAALREILTNEGAVPRLIGPRLGSVASSEDRASRLDVDVSLEAAPSVLFDAVALPAGVASALISNGLALEFIREQYRHCKPMFVAEESLQLLEIAGVKAGSEREPVEGIVIGNSNKPIEAVFAEFLEAIAAHRALSRDRDPPGV